MSEKDSPEKTQSITDELWKKARTMFQEQLAEIYKIRSKRQLEKKTDGILMDHGTPHEPALLLQSDGSLKWIQSGWRSEPFEGRKISDMEFCILATEIIENSPKPKTPKPKK